MPTYRDRGIVLKIQPLRDADRRYAIFTEHHGKISVLAQGTRRGKSKLSPHLAVFGVVDLMVARGRRWDRLAGAAAAQAFNGILESLPKTAVAQSFLLTVNALTKPELQEDRIFRLLVEFLAAVERSVTPTAGGRSAIFDAAALKLLGILGFAPEFDVCVHCRGEIGAVACGLSIHRGGLECPACRDRLSLPLSVAAVAALRALRREPLTVCPSDWSPNQATEVRRAVDALLCHHLEERFAALAYLKAVS